MQNNETINEVLDNGFSLYADVDAKSDIGEYPITLSSSMSSNYIVNFQSGVLTVTKAPLALSVGKYSREYGLDNPQFMIEYIGLKNGEQTPKWDNSPTFFTDATTFSNAGVYQVSVTCDPHNYEVISKENGTLTITKAPLLLTANSVEREYYSENPDFTYTLSGLRNNDNADCMAKQPIYSCDASIESDCGVYTITPSKAEAMNYDITCKEGTLTITPAPLVLQPVNVTREYGDSNPILKYDAIGLKGEDVLLSSLTNEPVLATTATESSNVGEYAIAISGGTSKNYSISYRQGMLTVTKAPLSIIAEGAEREYGENNPVFTCSYLGFKLNDIETTAFSSFPRLSCSASKTSDVGSYPITVNGGTSRNYEVVSYEDGVLNIRKAPMVLTANDKSRLYFEDNPYFDYELSGLKNSDTKSCLITQPSYICEASKASDVGDYAIEPSGASATNYDIEYRPGTLSVNKRELVASVGNYTKIYGENNPEFEVVYTGFVNNEDKSVLTTEAKSICPADEFTDVGTYSISIEGGSAVNYFINQYNPGNLTISKADQILTWNQDLSDIQQYSQIALEATSSAGLPVTYEMSPNNVATLYNNGDTWYLDCFGKGAVNVRAVQNGDKNHNAAKMLSQTLVVFGSGEDPSTPQIYPKIRNYHPIHD